MSTTARPTPSVSETTSKVPRGTLYRGREGMWSWVLHRITGVAIFFFLLVDTTASLVDARWIRQAHKRRLRTRSSYSQPTRAATKGTLTLSTSSDRGRFALGETVPDR